MKHLIDFGGICFYMQTALLKMQFESQILFLAAALEGENCAADLVIDVKDAEIQVNAAGAVFVQFQKALSKLFQPF